MNLSCLKLNLGPPLNAKLWMLSVIYIKIGITEGVAILVVIPDLSLIH